MLKAFDKLTRELEVERSLDEPKRLRERIEALNRLEAFPLNNLSSALDSDSIEANLYRRANASAQNLKPLI